MYNATVDDLDVDRLDVLWALVRSSREELAARLMRVLAGADAPTAADAVAARWLDPAVKVDYESIFFPAPGLDHPTTVPGVWIHQSKRTPRPPLVWRVCPIRGWVEIRHDHRGRYRLTCADGKRRRLTLDELTGETP